MADVHASLLPGEEGAMRPPRIEWGMVVLWALLIFIGVMMFVAAQTEKAL